MAGTKALGNSAGFAITIGGETVWVTAVALADQNGNALGLADNADAVAASATADKIGVISRLTGFNGTTWDRLKADTNGLYIVPKPVTAGGMSKARVVTGTTGTIKASAGQLYGLTVYNANAAVRYLHLYNKASAPTLSTDTPVMTIPMLGASVRDITLNDHGSEFTTGIAWAYTTDDIAIPATAGTSAELHFTAHYK